MGEPCSIIRGGNKTGVVEMGNFQHSFTGAGEFLAQVKSDGRKKFPGGDSPE